MKERGLVSRWILGLGTWALLGGVIYMLGWQVVPAMKQEQGPTAVYAEGDSQTRVFIRNTPEGPFTSNLQSGTHVDMVCWIDVPDASSSKPNAKKRFFLINIPGTSAPWPSRAAYVEAGFVKNQRDVDVCTRSE